MDAWSSGEGYEPYVGRWSRLVAREFVRWLDPPPGARWLDVGSGTGALTETVLSLGSPSGMVGLDPSPAFVRYAVAHVADRCASFGVGDARALPVRDGRFDLVVSGLMLNFVPERTLALREMRRAARSDGIVAAYVWDYPGRMQLMSYFWEAAVELDPAAGHAVEGVRFGFCRPDPLRAMFAAAGLTDVEVDAVVVPTVFRDFDDYWSPFLRGIGPAPVYATSLEEGQRTDLRESLRARLPAGDDGSIRLTARAWAVRGRA
jgi:SAM-dependent methyltransferase